MDFALLAFQVMRFRSMALVAVAVLLPASAATRDQEPPRFSAGSELVVLQVTVTDRKGAYVEGLGQEAFSVVEDGQPQVVRLFTDTNTPATIGLLLDNSGSMFALRQTVIDGAAAFAKASHPEDEIFALAFNDDVRSALPRDAPFTSDGAVLRAALERSIITRGRTALYDAISAGVDYLSRGTRPRKTLIVLSDGGDNASRAITQAAAVRKAQQSNAVIYTVALIDPLSRDANPALLKALAQESGGESFRADDAREVTEALERIARSIRHTYVLGYTSTNAARDGAFRRVRVVATATPGRPLVVRTRTGYVAGTVVP